MPVPAPIPMARHLSSLRVVVIILFIVVITAPALSENAKIQLKAAVLKNFPPQYSLSAGGDPEGFAIDVLSEIARLADADIHFVIKENWTEMFDALRSGEVDLIPNLGITDRRKAWFGFTSPVETFPVRIFVRKASKDIHSVGDLAGKKVGVVRLNVGERLMADKQDIEPIVYEQIKDALFDLLAGSLDAIVYPEPVLRLLARSAGLEHQITIVGSPLIEIKRAISVRKDNRILLKRLDDAVIKFVGSPAYERIYAKWYGESPPPFTIRQLVAMMAVTLVAAIIGMVVWRYRSLVRINTALEQSVHKRRQAEKKLREAHDRLEARVRQRTQSLVTTNEKLTDEIDRRSQAEKELLEKERFLASVFDAIQDGIGVLSPDLKIIRTNKAMQTWYAHHAPLEGKSCFHVYRDRDRPCTGCPVIRSIESRRLEKFEVPLIQEGRQNGILELYAFPIIDEDGEVTGIVEYARDVSKQKHAEQEQRALTRKLEMAQQLAKSGWWEFDVRNNTVIWPEETYALYGLDPDKTVIDYNRFMQCIHPDYHDYHNRQLDVIFDKGIAEFQYPITRPDGVERWIWARGEAEYDEKGDPIKLFGTLQDITERIRIEQQLRFQAQVMNQVHDSIITVAMDGTITSWNKGSEKLFGHTEQEVLGRHVSLVYPEESQDMLQREIIPKLLSRERLEIETTLFRTGNQPFEAMVSLSVLKNETEEITGMIGYTLDITKRKRAEQALADSERRLTDIIEFLPDPVFVIDTDGRVIAWNRAMERITGIGKNEMIGKGEYEYAVPFYGKARPMLIDQVLGRDTQWKKEYLMLREEDGLLIFSESFHPSMQGAERYLAGTAGRLYDAQGNVVGAIETIRDITQTKRTEQEREQLIIELKDALARVKTLSGLLPICAKCKKVRDDSGYWRQLDTYIQQHTDANVSHGLCPDCMEELYGGQEWYERGKKKGKF
jgi:PAS domain S-box-containing protein